MPSGLAKIRLIAGIIFVFALAAYSLFVFWDYIEGPTITVVSPSYGESTSSPTIILTGIAEHINYISLNDRPIYVDEQGNFKERLLLAPGMSIIKVYATDRFGREATELFRYHRTSDYTTPEESRPSTTTNP